MAEATICLGASINFSPYFPHLLSDLGQIRYEKSARNSAEYLVASFKSAYRKPHFFGGGGLNNTIYARAS